MIVQSSETYLGRLTKRFGTIRKVSVNWQMFGPIEKCLGRIGQFKNVSIRTHFLTGGANLHILGLVNTFSNYPAHSAHTTHFAPRPDVIPG